MGRAGWGLIAAARAWVWAAAACAVVLGCTYTAAFEATIDLGPGQRRCIGEQLSKHVLIVGEFRVVYPPAGAPGGPPGAPGGPGGPLLLHVQATDPASKTPVFQQSSRDRVKTGFTSTKPGLHMFCVKNISKQQIAVEAQLLWGPAARDYSQLAKAEQLDEVLLQLLQLQDKLKLFHNNILFLREKDEKMRQQTEAAAATLLLFSALNICLLVAASLLSAFFFKRFFRSKKII
ncbi:transmembrane trafficking protein, transmembrane protein Tmp21 precursor, putative [Eimeria necatrix]|uniref:Transmembrane trafficking protein, transmembrane protein Tmp21, putative n=1 Tax=Eimeria necatrix TaxID=51315 RepID=U6N6G1_9EIME|nr:transmembrane trafficking protein, transmembrane protein Tmp21 precursor, putative [Eimeria necatrix]CDJ69496.1 transmembrane trafficking protein, transmembrane protein Tmp21 precursor, putative [Eimeria necatrix]